MQQVQSVFEDIQESASVTSKQVFSLLEVYEQNKDEFIDLVTQCYLKIIKNLLKAPKGIIKKYEQFSEKFFKTAYQQYNQQKQQNEGENNNRAGKKQQKAVTQKEMFDMFIFFSSFFVQGLESSQLQIKVFCAKILFFIFKTISGEELAEHLPTNIAKKLIVNIIGMLRDKKQVLKSIGIKITSLIQLLSINEDLQDEMEVLNYEMIKIMCQDDREVLRKLAVTNMDLNDSTFHYLVKRIRDKDADIRSTVFRKLIKEKIKLSSLQLADIYKLIYDGMGSRDQQVRDSCIQYLQLNFKMFKEFELGQEEHKDDLIEEEGQVLQKRKRFQTPKKEEAYKEIKNAIVNFLQTFEVQKTLIHAHLYEILEDMTKQIIKNVLNEDLEMFCQYLRELLVTQMNLKKKKDLTIDCCELFLLRVLCSMIYGADKEEANEINKEIQQTIEDNFPPGIDFCKVILYYLGQKNQDTMALYQCILMSEFFINCDEAGRTDLQSALIKVCNDMPYHEIDLSEEQECYNDVFLRVNKKTLYFNKFDQGYYESPIIITSYDILPIVIRILRKIMESRPLEFVNKVVQIINEVREPFYKEDDENDLNSKLNHEQKKLEDTIQQIVVVEEKIKAQKKNKSKQTAIYELEKEKEELQDYQQKLKETIDQYEKLCFRVNLHSLSLASSLLLNCRITGDDSSIAPTILGIMRDVITPVMLSDSNILQALAVKSYIFYMLMSVDKAQEYCKIPLNYLQELEEEQDYKNCQMKQLVSLKGVLDYLMLYDVSKQELTDISEQLIRIAFKAELRIKIPAIEGICRLIYNDKIKDPSLLCCLLIIWLNPVTDNQNVNKSNYNNKDYLSEPNLAKLSQIITAFFKKFSQKNVQNQDMLEKALEMFVLVIVNMKRENKDFNFDYIKWFKDDNDLVTKFVSIGVTFMRYSENNKNIDYSLINDEIGPQERFFIFLLKKASNNTDIASDFRQFLFSSLSVYDFVDQIQISKMNLYFEYFETFMNENGESNKEISQFWKLFLKKKDDLAAEKPDYQEDREQQKFDHRMIDDGISETQILYSTLMKNLTDYQVVVKGVDQLDGEQKKQFNKEQSGIHSIVDEFGNKSSNQKNKKGNQTYDDEDDDEEEEKDDNSNEEQNNLEQDNKKGNSDEEEIVMKNTNNQNKRLGRKKKIINESDEQSVEESEEVIIQQKEQPKKKQVAKNKKVNKK